MFPVTNDADPNLTKESKYANHGGECIIGRSTLSFVPIDSHILQAVAMVNDAPARFAGIFRRLKGGAIMMVTIYLWTGEGLSNRNWLILHQISTLCRMVTMPIIILGDFNMAPEILFQAGIITYLDLVIMKP